MNNQVKLLPEVFQIFQPNVRVVSFGLIKEKGTIKIFHLYILLEVLHMINCEIKYLCSNHCQLIWKNLAFVKLQGLLWFFGTLRRVCVLSIFLQSLQSKRDSQLFHFFYSPLFFPNSYYSWVCKNSPRLVMGMVPFLSVEFNTRLHPFLLRNL